MQSDFFKLSKRGVVCGDCVDEMSNNNSKTRDWDGLDLAVACSLQDHIAEKQLLSPIPHTHELRQPKLTPSESMSIVDKKLELVDPNPNIFQLFMEYDSMFLWGKLASSGVVVDWSTKIVHDCDTRSIM